jgi:hypothetical protein
MPRRREVPKRDILPDPKFGNVEVSKFINAIMQSGKKSVAERIVYGAFDIISTKGGKDPLEVFLLRNGQCEADGRSEVPPGRGCQLSGSGRSAPGPPCSRLPCAGCVSRPASVRRSPWASAWPPKCWKRPRAVVVPSRSVMKFTVWPKPTRLSLTSASNAQKASEPIRPFIEGI